MRSVLRERLYQDDLASVNLSCRFDLPQAKVPALSAKRITQQRYDEAEKASISFNYLQYLAKVLLNLQLPKDIGNCLNNSSSAPEA